MADRQKFSDLRRSLVLLRQETQRLVRPFLSDQAVVRGSVYELKRKCGKQGCRCTRGDLHRSMVVSASEKGKTKLRPIPRGFLVEVRVKVKRYQQLRKARSRMVEVHRQMLQVMDEMARMREEAASPSGKQRS